MDEGQHTPEPVSLPEHVAQRVIARAIELDTDGASRMPIARLRDIALEAGITSHSLERALAETLSGAQSQLAAPTRRMGYLRRLGQRLVGNANLLDPEAEPELWSIRGALEAVATNVLAFATFWVPTFLLLSFLHSAGYFRSGAASTASVLVGTLAGIVIARRLRAYVTLGILSLCAVGITVNLISDTMKASQTAGFFGSSAFTWLLSALLGVGAGLLLARSRSGARGGAVGSHSVAVERASAGLSNDESAVSDEPFLRLRLQRA